MTTSHAKAAQHIRRYMKAEGIKHKVRSSTFAGGTAVYVTLFDVPSHRIPYVRDFCAQYEGIGYGDTPRAKYVNVEICN